MERRRAKGLGRLLAATGHSLAGLRAALAGETAFRQELALCAVLLPLGLWLGEDGAEKALLAGSLLLVLVAELLNSAVEAAVDHAGTAPHPLAKRAKDLGSAAVFVALATAALVWLLLALPVWTSQP